MRARSTIVDSFLSSVTCLFTHTHFVVVFLNISFFFLLCPLELEDSQHEFGSKLVVIMGKNYHLLPFGAESKRTYFYCVSGLPIDRYSTYTNTHPHFFPFFFFAYSGVARARQELFGQEAAALSDVAAVRHQGKNNNAHRQKNHQCKKDKDKTAILWVEEHKMKREGEGGKEGEKGEGGSDDARTFWLLLVSTFFFFVLSHFCAPLLH